jgi:hypothetical protein
MATRWGRRQSDRSTILQRYSCALTSRAARLPTVIEKLRGNILTPFWTECSDRIFAENGAGGLTKFEKHSIVYIGSIGKLRAQISSPTADSTLAVASRQW